MKYNYVHVITKIFVLSKEINKAVIYISVVCYNYENR